MTTRGVLPGTGSDLPAVRVFELLNGSEYAVFFAARDEELPSENVGTELRALARRSQNAATRGVADVMTADVISGLIGGAAWAAVAKALVATTSYLRRRRDSTPAADKATVSMRLETASMKILMEMPPTLAEADIRRLEDGRWSAEFTYQGDTIRVAADPGATIVTWTRNPGARPAHRPISEQTHATVGDFVQNYPADPTIGGPDPWD
jgi:hypothetical protein